MKKYFTLYCALDYDISMKSLDLTINWSKVMHNVSLFFEFYRRETTVGSGTFALQRTSRSESKQA